MAENRKRVLLNQGKAYWNGDVILDNIKCKIYATPTVATSKALGEMTSSSRWAGVEYKVEMTEYKHTSHTRDYVKEFLSTGLAPEITIQGVDTDKNSDYYDNHGANTITATGCIMTSDINLIELDASSTDHTQETINFNAKNIQMS